MKVVIVPTKSFVCVCLNARKSIGLTKTLIQKSEYCLAEHQT